MNENLYLLDADKNTEGVLSNRMPFSLPFYNDVQERSLDDFTDTLTFSIPANHSMAEKVTADKYILYPTFDLGYKLYKIKEVAETSGETYVKEIYAEVSAQDELLKTIVRPSTFNSATLDEVITYILNGTEWNVGEIDDFEAQTYVIEEHTNALEALVSAVQAYGGEMDYEYEMARNSTKVTSQQVSVYTQLGDVTGLFFTHGKDVKGVERIEDTTKLVTALIGVGKANEAGVPLSFDGYNPTLSSKYERGADWLGSLNAVETYSKGEHIFGVYKDDNAQSKRELYNNTLTALKTYCKPLMTYKVTLTLLEKLTGYEHMLVRLGDTIVVQDESVSPALYVKARIRKLSRSITNPTSDAVELGDYIPVVPPVNKNLAKLQAKISAKEEIWNKAVEIPAIQEKINQVPTKEDLFSNVNQRLKFRYVRDYINGSDKDTLNHWVEFQIYKQGVNIAKGMVPTSDTTLTNSAYLTDEIIDSSRAVQGGAGLKYIQLDLGAITSDIEYFHIWHYFADKRTYNKHYVDVSEDGILWTRLYNSDKAGTVVETINGQILPVNSSAILESQKKTVNQVVQDITDLTDFKQSAEASLAGKVDAVAYNEKLSELNQSIADKAGLEYVDGKLVDKANVDTTYTKPEVDSAINGRVATTTYTTDKAGIITRLDAHDTSITQSDKEIALKASQATVDELEGRVANAEASLTVNADAIKLRVTKDEAKDIAKSVNRVPMRYVRYVGDGSNINGDSHLVEIGVYDSAKPAVDVAIGKAVTSGNTDATNLTYITDGNTSTSNAFATLGADQESQWAMIDLGKVYEDISVIKVWNYWTDTTRKYNYKMQVSEDAINWVVLYDSERQGTYVPTSAGFEIFANQQKAIYSFATEIRETAEAISLKADAETVDDLGNRLASAELLIDKDAIISTVTSAQEFADALSDKADSSALADKADASTVEGIKQDLEEKYVKQTELAITAEGINMLFKSAGGVNIVSNSVGYASTDFWAVTGLVDTDQNDELLQRGAGSGFYMKGGSLVQSIPVRGGIYTISALVKKDATGTGYIKATYDGTTVKQVSFIEGTVLDYDVVGFTVEVEGTELILELQGSDTSGIVFTSLMVNVGELPLQWTHAVGELYTNDILFNQNGITVKNSGYDGYTTINSEEFAGYYMMDGVYEEVFSLNKDTTVVNKLEAKQAISMGVLKIVPVKTDTLNGWAFVANEE